MIFWLFLILFIILIVVRVITEGDYVLVGLFAALDGFVVVCCVVFLAINQINVTGQIRQLHERYDSLAYQLENDIYDNDNDLGLRDLMVDIEKWNKDIAYYKEAQDDFWIGIFIPNIYDEFEYIELP